MVHLKTYLLFEINALPYTSCCCSSSFKRYNNNINKIGKFPKTPCPFCSFCHDIRNIHFCADNQTTAGIYTTSSHIRLGYYFPILAKSTNNTSIIMKSILHVRYTWVLYLYVKYNNMCDLDVYKNRFLSWSKRLFDI